ncbi:hypothetical protein BT67DRAFT_39884 [Trichocladium antarcticum]|uniref:Uncharacterized protein n=1 Tax=Trichocladium antarcticum TaxID=1450529 RepID=A0AAN6UJ35_9PEZI|nr:hypothetical protein BT67DRAFT_39884 [Trichocladium antarcticum]
MPLGVQVVSCRSTECLAGEIAFCRASLANHNHQLGVTPVRFASQNPQFDPIRYSAIRRKRARLCWQSRLPPETSGAPWRQARPDRRPSPPLIRAVIAIVAKSRSLPACLRSEEFSRAVGKSNQMSPAMTFEDSWFCVNPISLSGPEERLARPAQPTANPGAFPAL